MTVFHDDGQIRFYLGNAVDILQKLPPESVHMAVTSPPYWGLRDYGTATWEGGDAECDHRGRQADRQAKSQPGTGNAGNVLRDGVAGVDRECGKCGARRVDQQLGLEATPEEFTASMVDVFREVKRVLRKDGTCWINIGDSYASGGMSNPSTKSTLGGGKDRGAAEYALTRDVPAGLKPKDLCGIPWMLAFALRADGWYLRSEIIWCLSGGTRVYARTARSEGPMTIHDLVRLDPSTVQLWNGARWTQVLGWSSRRSETLRLTLRSGERIICSPNHRWPLADERLVEARELAIGDVLATTTLPEPATFPDGIADDMAWFAGLYLAEGSHSDDAIQIAGHADEVERHERVFQIAERYGGSAVIHAGSGNGVNLVVHSAVLEGVLRHFLSGRTALDKHLHSRAWRYVKRHSARVHGGVSRRRWPL